MTNSKNIVLEYLKNDPTPKKSGDIVSDTGLDKKEVTKIINSLKKEELIYSPKRCFYQIKD